MFNASGAFTWTCPPGVTSVSMVAIGGGAGGTHAETNATSGGDSYFIDTAVVFAGGGAGYRKIYNDKFPPSAGANFTGDGGGHGGLPDTTTGNNLYAIGGGGASYEPTHGCKPSSPAHQAPGATTA